jgi:hypothetical protein
MTSFSLVSIYQRFGGIYCLLHQVRKIFYFEGQGFRFLRNFAKYLWDYTASNSEKRYLEPRWRQSTGSPKGFSCCPVEARTRNPPTGCVVATHISMFQILFTFVFTVSLWSPRTGPFLRPYCGKLLIQDSWSNIWKNMSNFVSSCLHQHWITTRSTGVSPARHRTRRIKIHFKKYNWCTNEKSRNT